MSAPWTVIWRGREYRIQARRDGPSLSAEIMRVSEVDDGPARSVIVPEEAAGQLGKWLIGSRGP